MRKHCFLLLCWTGCGEAPKPAPTPIQQEYSGPAEQPLHSHVEKSQAPTRCSLNTAKLSASQEFSSRLAGEWTLYAYKMYQIPTPVEVPLSQANWLEDVETWRFQSSTYTHRMSDTITFSGTYRILATQGGCQPPGTGTESFLLHVTRAPNPATPTTREAWYHLEWSDEQLTLALVGSEKGTWVPNQGHLFRRQ